MARFADSDGQELIGYTDRWSVAPGERIQLMASSSNSPITVQMIRLRHGDPNPAGPGLRAEPVPSAADGAYPCGQQTVQAGSFAVLDSAPAGSALSVWAWTRVPARGRRQVLVARGPFELFLDAKGLPSIQFGDRTLSARKPLRPEEWTRLRACFAEGAVRLEVAGDVIATGETSLPAPAGPVTLAASAGGGEHFSGRLEELQIDEDTFDVGDLRLVNGPTLAVTGRTWDDDTTDYRGAPGQYAAVHFHEDDVEDAGWQPVADLVVPANVRSGVYAFRLTAADLTDHVPFVVTPPRGRATARIGLLLPTLTYLAYSNERMIAAGEGGMVPTGHAVDLAPADAWLSAHPEAGVSAYDRHADGSGCCLMSMRRPVPNFRPDFVWWNTGAPERFSADLYITDFLDQRGEAWDAFTDHDLHEQGAELLRRYAVIVTGTHPEYCSRQMLVALEQYLNSGGRLMYLGGNGFYWVTSIDPQRPHVAEVRRGVNGTRAWTSRPGELRHQTTGEQGGLWRYRNRPPNALVGVGFAAQSDSRDLAPGYRRTPMSFEPAYSWIFNGVSDADVIGDYGLSLGGAAGYEIDRHDPALGSPDRSPVLMTSRGMHPDSYLLVVEDAEVMIPNVTSGTNSRVRSDVVYLPYEGGGAVFSVGSCSWCGSLSHNGYDNDIYRITDNVLTAFASGGGRAKGQREARRETGVVASDYPIATRHEAELSAIEHLWPHSNDLEWDEYTERGLRVFASGQGSTLTDVQGRTYLDGLAGLFLVNVGHGRTEIGAAMAEQAGRLAYTASSNSTNPATVALAETIASITPGDLDRVFFCSGGSEAVETALKIAKQAQVLRGYPKRYKIICRRGSYHGQTFGAMSLTSSAKERYFGPFMAGVCKVPSPNHYRNDFGLEGEAGDLMCARYVEQEILAQGPEHVAAVIGEPISAANGTHLPSPLYWQELRRICDRHGVFLIMDEVITGYGRTGAMFAAEHYGVVPDIMTMAKGLSSGYAPIGAVAVRREVFDAFTKHGNAINHLLTFGGHAVAAAAASKNIEIIQRENLVERSAEMGRYLLELADGLREHPTVGDVRGGKGLLCAIDLVRSKETRQAWGDDHPFIKGLALRTQEQGLITRVWDVLHLAPPLVITNREVEVAIEIVDRCLTEMEREFAADIG